ncbi:MAG: WG repeat-containing protein [Bacteroidota bacterium]
MKKIIILIVCFLRLTFCEAQNMVLLNNESTGTKEEETVLLSPSGKVLKTFTGIDIKMKSEDMICAIDLKTKKLGYLSAVTGNWVIQPQFKNVYNPSGFSEGLVVIKSEISDGVTKSAVYDKTGKLILPFCDWDISDYSDGMAIVEKPGYQFGAIDRTGKLVVPFSVGKLNNFINGVASKGNNKEYVDDYAEDTGLWGFMDKTGKMVVPQEWSWVSNFSEGVASVKNKEKKWGFINTSGKLVISCIYESAGAFSEGFSAVTISSGKDKGMMSFIDKNGKRATSQEFDVAREFVDGMAAVVKITKSGEDEEDYQFGFIDKNFKLVIPIAHHKANSSGYYIQYFSFSDGLCPTTKGYINKSGKLVITFPDAEKMTFEPFSNGTALITIFLGESTKDYLIDKTGKILWKSGPHALKAG